ncbi:Aldo/keto reductase [Piedraia hortae CBS 480.64]|uniref:Aldo/keto reductase n=1 Tax=Piedraia hortae CBS 480.64 TaxID=1314780 RepID=A0A6A7C8G5_9PEZI|nr:Aldo/keto reductase [Piedraia hortae CBS 480.64]
MATEARPPLSSVLPPLIFGTTTFNYLYNEDPYELNADALVHRALEHGVRAFDTSPYYGPSEEILGAALAAVNHKWPRETLHVNTKVGRIAADRFDYSRDWVKQSVQHSLRRLRTNYLDLVFCHDVEFVSESEVLDAVAELRRMRDDGVIRYIGISGYPLSVLASIARRVLRETGEPLDAVMSYAHFTLQNTMLATVGIKQFQAAGVDVVLNGSPLGMGLLRREGVPVGSMGDWHPACNKLRAAVKRASDFCDVYDERLEVIAIRYSLEQWVLRGAVVGSYGDPASGVPNRRLSHDRSQRLGVSLMGISKISELDKTLKVWRSILDGLEDGEETARRAGRWSRDHEWSLNRRRAIEILADGIREYLDEFIDYSWPSPPVGFVNQAASLSAELPTPAMSLPRDDAPREEGKALPLR